ncbi:MAG: AAA family ATPase [Prevotellaceae bacterium]|jgi:predicted ATP-binding protein involved in virulence|nr:AAA family ATPase [Prevotellaceae bacterium]
MYIDKLQLKNFRCYEQIDVAFHPRFNVFVGVNGTGKTSMLEALRIAIGSLFLGVDKYKEKIASPSILLDDARLANLEAQYPVVIQAEGVLEAIPDASPYPIFREQSLDTMEGNARIVWERSLDTRRGNTRSLKAKEIKNYSLQMQKKIRQADTVNIPLVTYYSTDRFKKERKDYGIEPDGSRLRGYFNALDPTTNIKFFLDLYYTETLSVLQQQTTHSAVLEAVNEAVKKCIDCDDLFFDIKLGELLLVQRDSHERMPFHLLSDGVRSMLALVMEMAFRCYLLNPHFGKEAALKTTGVVLLDEIDLHLHPQWQKKVIGDLRSAFPQLQFIVTTHAPLVIGSLNDGKIFSIKGNDVYDFPLQHGRDANYILNELGVAEMDERIKNDLANYYLLIEEGKGGSTNALALRQELEELLGIDHTALQRADMMLSFF